MASSLRQRGLIEQGPIALADAPPFPSPKTVKVAKLVAADVRRNANKFYSLELQATADGQQYRCLCNYGRVGASGRFEVRGHSYDRLDAEDAFDRVYREKTRSGRYREVNIVADAAGTALATVQPAGLLRGADAFRSGARAPAAWSTAAQAFYNEMLREAQCLVETGMQASGVTSAGLSTPLGVVGEADIRDALQILDLMAGTIETIDRIARDPKRIAKYPPLEGLVDVLEKLNAKFFRRIPTPVGGTRVKLRDAMIKTAAQVADKEQLLQSALGLIAAQQPQGAAVGYPVLLEDVDKAEGDLLTKLLRAERCRCHDNQRLSWTAAFRVTREADMARYRKDLCGPKGESQMLLFHGTRRTTAAGILSRGLLPTRAATAAGGNYSGSAFGDGVYFARNAGKSLGYTGASAGERVLFVAFVAMGKAHVHTGRSHGAFRRQTGCDSVHAVGGLDLLHDEMIVPSGDQACLAYVLTV
jgi:predicted DNA-binding WGR domain protein